MGSAQSTEGRREYNNARASFSSEEIKRYDDFFGQLAGDGSGVHHSPSKQHQRKFNWESFDRLTGRLSKDAKTKIYGEFCRITQRVANKPDCNYVTYDAYYIGLSLLLKGSLSEKAYIFKLLCSENNIVDKIHLANVAKYLLELITLYIEIEQQSKAFVTWHAPVNEHNPNALVDYFVSEWHKYYEKYNTNETVNDEWLEKWLGNDALLLNMMSVVFSSTFDKNFRNDDSTEYSIPFCVGGEGKYFRSLLDVSSIVLLNAHIPAERRREWRLLYSTDTHGESFSTLIKTIINEGPLLIVIKDKTNCVFGGFCSVNLDLSPNFVGDDRCFLFTLIPSLRIYEATGFNKNYCYLNMHQDTMPNGLGFGGRLSIGDTPIHFFGLWLDSEFGRGKSQGSCSTYNNPQLSSSENFEIFQMEVWGVGNQPENKKVKAATSILDSDPEVKAMLAMAGKGPVSEGLRETDETAGIPEQRKLTNM